MTQFVAMSCPQCGAPLPKQASWRMVICAHCGSSVTKSEDVVEAAHFHEAWLRTRQYPDDGSRRVRCGGQEYRILARLGSGDYSEVFAAERLGLSRQLVTLKIARDAGAEGALRREFDVLEELQAIERTGAAYFSQRLPQPLAWGHESQQGRGVLALRHPPGFWGSLDAVQRNYPNGIPPRHAVWIWRRMLEVLGYVHASGWTHNDLRLEHLLVHPRDHGVLLIGWDKATHGGLPARDLMQSAWAVRALLAGSGFGAEQAPPLPAGFPRTLGTLLRRASEDSLWYDNCAAEELDRLLVAAAHEAFGPPSFIAFDPQAKHS